MVTERDAANVFLISGDDEARIAAAAAKLVRRFAGENPDPFSLDIIREQDGASPGSVINAVIRSVRSPSFLGGRKTVWLQDFRGFKAEGVAKDKSPGALAFQTLAALVKEGVPADIVLILSGPGIDGGKMLARACKKHGKFHQFKKLAAGQKDCAEKMERILEEQAAEKGLSLSRDVRDYLVRALGVDTGRIDGELEKLIAYCGGPEQPVTLAAAEAVVSGQGEEANWALGEAIGQRDLGETLRVVAVVLPQIVQESRRDEAGASRGLIGQTAKTLRQMLQVKLFMASRKIRRADAVQRALETMSEEDKKACREQGMEFVDFHPYRARKLAERAGRYSGHELIDALRHCRDAYWQSASTTPVSGRVILEELLIRVIGAKRR